MASSSRHGMSQMRLNSGLGSRVWALGSRDWALGPRLSASKPPVSRPVGRKIEGESREPIAEVCHHTGMPPTDATAPAAPEISHDELARRLADPALTIVDVLPADSYEAGHLPHARSLPLAELRARAPEVLPDRQQEIAVYCGGPT